VRRECGSVGVWECGCEGICANNMATDLLARDESRRYSQGLEPVAALRTLAFVLVSADTV